MAKILIPIDGSEASLRAVDHVIAHRTWYPPPLEVHLVNAQRPLPSDVSRFIAAGDVKGFHHDEGVRALAEARARLDTAGIGHAFHISVGEPGHVIAHYVKELQCDQVVMTTHGQGASSLVLGSIAAKVVQQGAVPVLLVK
jgi:nucleotide-binding universal stress UspA family protein